MVCAKLRLVKVGERTINMDLHAVSAIVALLVGTALLVMVWYL